jgi:2-(1,2-epoxy-1,2-dihydrophenyl)acetyl-CoA isomerase
MSEDFSFTIDGPLATLTFTRPDKANAFHPRMAAGMRRCFIEIQHTPSVRCLLIKGEGKHFMAGGDLEAIVDFDKVSDVERSDVGEGVIHEYNVMVRTMQRLDVPVVASVQGGVAGAAVGFVGACDLVIAADTAFFWIAHVLHGGSIDGLTTFFTPRHIGLRKAMELALLADRISGTKAAELGLINFAVPEAQLAVETAKLVKRLCEGPTKGYGKIKKLLYASFGNSMMEQGRMEAESYGEILHTQDVQDGLKAFFERRPPKFSGR